MSTYSHPLQLAFGLALSAALAAQSPLTTTFNSNWSTAVGGAIYFDVAVSSTLSIVQFDLNCSGSVPVGTPVTIDVYTTPNWFLNKYSTPAAWTLATTGAGVTQPQGTPTPMVLSSPLTLAGGVNTSYGILIKANGFGHAATIGTCCNWAYHGTPLGLYSGIAQNTMWSSTFFGVRVVNARVHYGQGAGPFVVASAASEGAGCGTPRLSLSALSRPLTGTNANLLLANAPAGSFGMVFVSFATLDPPVPLVTMGAQTCYQHISSNAITPISAMPGGHIASLMIPGGNLFLGVPLAAQGLALAPGVNALGALTSNAVAMRIGNL